MQLTFLIYLVFSWRALVWTSGGWISLLYEYYGAIFFTAIFLFFLILQFSKIKPTTKISILETKNWFFLMCGMQAITLLSNIGDCGDKPGHYFFFQTLFENTEICTGYPSANFASFINVFLFFALGYAACTTMWSLSLALTTKKGITIPQP